MTAVLDRPQADVVFGSETPRLSTEPLRPLTPETSYGFEAIAFAQDVLGVELLPWQKWWLIHALELREDGTFRFRTVLTLVGRQNGKTTLLKIVALYFMYLGRARMVLGAAQSLDIARESWQGAVELAEECAELQPEVGNVRRANGEQCLTLESGARYRITAATRSAGRGLSVDLLILDELREHRDWLAWGALSKTTTARPNAITVGISNAGDDQSVVLNHLRSSAIAGEDDSLALFEWSAPDDCDLADVTAWAQANPGLGRTISHQAIRSAMSTDPPATFRTETLCQRVDALDAAVDLAAWKAAADKSGTLEAVREKVGVVVDVAPDGQHVTLSGAALLDDGRTRVEVMSAWASTTEARRALFEGVDGTPGLLQKIAPYVVGWFPGGPAAALAAEFRSMKAAADEEIERGTRPGRRVHPDVVELTGTDVGQACQGFADLVAARRVLHPDDPLLNAHLAGAQKLHSGDGWRFCRKGVGHVDALYAAAGAIHVVRTVPAPAPVKKSVIY